MAKLIEKPPVVVVLGHVDHGKSSLLEAIRKEIRITARESGGITQHIGAYEVERNGKKITFIDTPGHEAFSLMRERGAYVADVALLVIDASEGVKAQTKEAAEAILKSKTPLIVVLNKIDKPGSQPELVYGQLQGLNIITEGVGGNVPSNKVSAKTGQGIDELLDTIILVSEMEELKEDIEAPCEGVVIESSKCQKRGVLVTGIIQKGELKVGDYVGTDNSCGKVKQLINFHGKQVKSATLSQPVEIVGFVEVPEAGQVFKVYQNLNEAKECVKSQKQKKTTDNGDQKTLNIVLKADVYGSLEALEAMLMKIPQDDIKLRIVSSGVGMINIQDIQNAENCNARVMGFKVKIDKGADNYINMKKIFPKTFDIIYKLQEEVKTIMERMLSPENVRIDQGKIKIIAIFKQNKKKQIIGGRVIDGTISKNTQVDIIRDEEVIGEGRIRSLEIDKREQVSVSKGKEAGMFFESETQIEENDILHVYKIEKEKKKL